MEVGKREEIVRRGVCRNVTVEKKEWERKKGGAVSVQKERNFNTTGKELARELSTNINQTTIRDVFSLSAFS